MSGGGLTQLVAYGAQDVYLTSQPVFTYFKSEFKQYSNFACELIENTFNGTIGFGRKANVTISRAGDLMHNVFLQVDLPDVVVTPVFANSINNSFVAKWTDELGHFLIKEVSVDIGGTKIDKHYGTWMSIWSSLTLQTGKKDGYLSMIGDDLDVITVDDDPAVLPLTIPGKTLYIPLQFWFCKSTAQALPLIALMYHEVKLYFEFERFENLFEVEVSQGAEPIVTTPVLTDASVWVNYVFLDNRERKQFAASPHEYLIEQLQHTGDESLTGTRPNVRINFNHPCKELLWVIQTLDTKNSNFTTLADGTGTNPTVKAKLMLNGHDRFAEKAADYFNKVQPYYHHTNTPAQGINTYSFALRPEEQQPSGTLNFSRIDNAQLSLEVDAAVVGQSPIIKIYAVNYNVLRIKSGMGGIAFSN